MALSEFRYTICPVGNASFIAADRNEFMRNAFGRRGVNPQSLQSLPEERRHAHYTHLDPALFREGGNIPPIWARSNGTETVLLGLSCLRLRQYILVRADSEIERPEELSGRRLCLPVRPNALIDFFRATVQRGFETLLKTIGLCEDDVEFVPTVVTWEKKRIGEAEADALDNGRVDAVFMLYAYAPRMIASGKYRAIYDLASPCAKLPPLNNEHPNILTVSTRLVLDAPDIVVEYVKQAILASRWARTHLRETTALFAKQLRSTEEEASAAFLPDFNEWLELSISDELLSCLEDQKRFLLNHGFIVSDFDIGGWPDESFLRAALSDIAKHSEREVIDYH
jgi:2'-hydroxybiphenyl-2-sulfinate desulfinase